MEFGSGSAVLGGNAADPLQEAMARRATGQAGATQQVSPSAPTFDPNMMPSAPISGMSPTGIPTAPVSNPAESTTPTAPEPVTPFDSPEAKQIIQALSNRLKGLTDLQKGPDLSNM